MTTLLIVTGASRGLGRAIAKGFAKGITGNVHMLLVARSEEGLEETRDAVSTIRSANDGVIISTFSMDLAVLDKLDANIDMLVEASQPLSQYEHVIVINNAGSLGHVGPTLDMASLTELEQALDFNITSSLWFTTRFAKACIASSTRCSIVNISSLCAIQPFPTMASYCTGKAARNMYHSVLAKELEHNTNVKILNYAPGALETDMTDVLRTSTNKLDDDLKTYYRSAHEKGELIAPEKTAAKLVRLVLEDEFESGKHIDYWDVYEEQREEVRQLE